MMPTRILSFMMSLLCHTDAARWIATALLDECFQFCGAVSRGVLREHSLARTLTDNARVTFRHPAQNRQHIFGGPGDEDLFVWREELGQPGPLVADNRRTTGRRFEQPDARRVAGANHVGPRHIEGETLRVIKGAVLLWLQVCDALNVLRPANRLRILRTCNNEPAGRRFRCRNEKEAVESRLPVGAVGAKITESPFQRE